MNKEKPTQKRLKEVLYYFPKKGIMIWKQNRDSKAKKGKMAKYIDKGIGYITISIDGTSYLLHRLAWLYMKGNFPKYQIDHIDRNKLNNKWDNLREVSFRENAINSKVQTNNKSGITGVSWSKKSNKWLVQITNLGKTSYLGYFINKTNAVKARYGAEIRYNFTKYNSTSSAYLYLKNKGLINK